MATLGFQTPTPSQDSSSSHHPRPAPILSTAPQRHWESFLPHPSSPGILSFSRLLLDPALPSRPVSGPASRRTHSGPDNGYTSSLSPTLTFTRPRLTLDRPKEEPAAGGAGSRSDPLHTAGVTWAGAASLSVGFLICREQSYSGVWR